MKCKKPIALLVALWVPSLASAQLSFEDTEVRIDAEFGAERVTHDFAFTNTGDYSVEIEDVRSSCGCTTANLDKRTYAPGESGAITGVFDVGSRVGERTNTISIRTDYFEQPSHHLVFRVDIPRPLILSDRFLTWRSGDEPETQTVEVEFHPDSPYELEEVEVDGERFTVEVIEDEETEGRYILEVTPSEITKSERAIIYLRTSPEPADPRAFSLYAYVR